MKASAPKLTQSNTGYATSTRFRRRPSRLAVKDLLPRAKVQPPVRDRHDHLAAHHLSLQVGVAVVFSAPIKTDSGVRFGSGNREGDRPTDHNLGRPVLSARVSASLNHAAQPVQETRVQRGTSRCRR